VVRGTLTTAGYMRSVSYIRARHRLSCGNALSYSDFEFDCGPRTELISARNHSWVFGSAASLVMA